MNTSPLALPPERLMSAPPSTPFLTMPSPRPYSVSGARPAPDPPSVKRIATLPPLIGRVQKLAPEAAVNTSVSPFPGQAVTRGERHAGEVQDHELRAAHRRHRGGERVLPYAAAE